MQGAGVLQGETLGVLPCQRNLGDRVVSWHTEENFQVVYKKKSLIGF